ncbi:MAG: response regulator [Anaerolineae bacterium]
MTIGQDWRMRRLIQANLEALELEVHGAVNGRHGLLLLDKHTPDLVLVDTDVPDMEVDHLLARVRDQLPGQVPIIVLSAEPPSRHLNQNGDAISYLLKPFAVHTLLQQVGQALESVPVGRGRTAQDE